MLKKFTLLIITGLLLSACLPKKPTIEPKRQVRQLINALEVSKRPFLVVFPHESGKLLTLYLDNVASSYKQTALDLEYLAGNSLKGGRTTIDLPKPMPFAQAFLLGSCSSGGKCSFDTDLISGVIKNKLDDGSETINVLKSDFVFVKGTTTSVDGRVVYTPGSPKQKDQIMLDTQGLPKNLEGTLAYSPLAISATTGKKITGKLTFKVSGVTKAVIFDGNDYRPLIFSGGGDQLDVTLDRPPAAKTVQIVRDDLRGASETQTVYLLGPILLLK